MSDMDKEFNEVVGRINSKIAEAAKLLAEANKLGKEAGMEVLGCSYYTMEDMSEEAREKMEEINFRPLMSALEDSGWSTSSMKC